jgi:uncharacterized protein YdhG (YjbR/CyaY superfamily)
MTTSQAAPATIDEYIAAFPDDVRAILEQVRATIRAAAPGAQETISYQIPTFKLGAKYLIYFAGYKRHISLYPAPIGIAEFEAAVSSYGAGKGTLKFPLDKPIPYDLIARVVEYRLAETHANATAKIPRRKAE